MMVARTECIGRPDTNVFEGRIPLHAHSLRRSAGLRYDLLVRRALTLSLVIGLGFAAAALAQENTGPHPVGEYAGVTPGTGHLPPRAPSGEARLLTWPGFQARPDGASRFFVQTTQPVQYRVENESGRAVIILENLGIHLRNNRRPLETRYFNTPVTRAKVERRGHDVALVLEMRAAVTPSVSVQPSEGAYHYLFIEFPAGDYLPADMQTQSTATVEAEPIDYGDQ